MHFISFVLIYSLWLLRLRQRRNIFFREGHPRRYTVTLIQMFVHVSRLIPKRLSHARKICLERGHHESRINKNLNHVSREKIAPITFHEKSILIGDPLSTGCLLEVLKDNSVIQQYSTYGSFILMNTRHVKKDTKTHTKPRNSKRNLFNLDMPTALDLSKIMKPSPPMENRKLDARPSMIYCPLTRYGIKAT